MRDRMPPEMLARAKGQAQNTNRINKLALDANGFSTTRAEKNRARDELIAAVGERQAKKLIRQAADKVAGS